jgi:hypothetical protein
VKTERKPYLVRLKPKCADAYAGKLQVGREYQALFSLAWAQLARARAYLYFTGTPTPELAAQARQVAERAQALSPDRPEGQLALGNYYQYVAVDNRQALGASEAGLRLAPNNVDLLVTAALVEQRLGHWDAAVQHLAKASALDPRSANTARRTGATLLWLRRYPEAQAALDRGLALAPTNLNIIELRSMVALAQADLAGARAVVRTALTAVEPAALLAQFGNYWDLYWVLDDAQQQQLLALPPSAFDNDRGTWAVVHAQTYHLRANPAQARIYADSAQLAYGEQLRATPEDNQRHVLRGLALAYLGRKAEAIAEGERGVALLPISRDAYSGAYYQPARAHLSARGRAREGARPARAAAQDPLLSLARVAPDRPHVRLAQGQPALRAAGGGEVAHFERWWLGAPATAEQLQIAGRTVTRTVTNTPHAGQRWSTRRERKLLKISEGYRGPTLGVGLISVRSEVQSSRAHSAISLPRESA